MRRVLWPSSRFAACIALLLSGPLVARGQNVHTVDPRTFGLDIPPGTVVHAEDERVTTHDERGEAVVARVHVRVGDRVIVLLPDGQLVARRQQETAPTDRRFEPASPDQMLERLVADQLAGFKTAQTRHYVYVYNCRPEFALATSRILESMIVGMRAHARRQGIRRERLEIPLVAILFRSEAEFREFRRVEPGVVAYYHPLTNHMVMYEETSLATVRPDLASQQAISTIAHEGAHQILHNIGVQSRLSVWPMWIGEGLAEYYAPTAFGEDLRWKGAGQINDMRMFELETYLKTREGGSAEGPIVEQTVTATRLTSTGYACAWALTHYLATRHRARFGSLIRQLSGLRPLESAVPAAETAVAENLELFKMHFGDDLARLDSQLIAHLKQQDYRDPFAHAPHFGAFVRVQGQSGANVFHTKELAQRWIDHQLKDATAEQRKAAITQVRSFPNRSAAEQAAQLWLGGR